MKRIAIIGASGMLGSMVYGELLKKGYQLTLVIRNKKKLRSLFATYGTSNNTKIVCRDLETVINQTEMLKFARQIGPVDGVINCAGIIPQQKAALSTTVVVNSILPHLLSLQYQEKLIHMSTDCVFNGNNAPYSETSPASPDSLYGSTKLIGEPKDFSLVIRTSLIGPELGNGHVSLLGWFLSQRAWVHGYTNHFWNGITTRQCAKICHEIFRNRSKFPKNGLYHVFSTDMSKYSMLVRFAEKYQKKIKIIPSGESHKDRRLTTNSDFCRKLHIPSFERMLDEL
jgi:dTDP-4-dehydrorhamnose reductase